MSLKAAQQAAGMVPAPPEEEGRSLTWRYLPFPSAASWLGCRREPFCDATPLLSDRQRDLARSAQPEKHHCSGSQRRESGDRSADAGMGSCRAIDEGDLRDAVSRTHSAPVGWFVRAAHPRRDLVATRSSRASIGRWLSASICGSRTTASRRCSSWAMRWKAGSRHRSMWSVNSVSGTRTSAPRAAIARARIWATRRRIRRRAAGLISRGGEALWDPASAVGKVQLMVTLVTPTPSRFPVIRPELLQRPVGAGVRSAPMSSSKTGWRGSRSGGLMTIRPTLRSMTLRRSRIRSDQDRHRERGLLRD